MIAADMLQQALAEDPNFDPIPAAYDSLRSACFAAIDAMAYLDENPNRAEYIKSLGDLHADVAPGWPRAAAMLVTVASWIQDYVDQEEAA